MATSSTALLFLAFVYLFLFVPHSYTLGILIIFFGVLIIVSTFYDSGDDDYMIATSQELPRLVAVEKVSPIQATKFLTFFFVLPKLIYVYFHWSINKISPWIMVG